MTNEEKKEYLSLKLAYQSTPFISELEKKNDYISKTPKTLFKYRKFDEYSFDMIENEYVYLAPAGVLDDPFDCLTNIDLENINDANSFNLSKEKVGVCSFTTKRDNKPMWSLYADTYKGYCIEYETLQNICPVIYTKEFDNNIIKTMVKFSLKTIIRFISSGQIKTEM